MIATRLRLTVVIAISYLAIAFVFSFIGFAAQQPTIHFREYTFPEAILEIGGHFVFGAVTALPFLSLEGTLLGGSFAVVIDVDHLLGALNLNVSSRPDHSLVFGVCATIIVWLIAKRLPLRGTALSTEKIAILVPSSILAHVAYDIFASYAVFHSLGFSFPLFVPFSFGLVSFPFWAWAPLELAAFFAPLAFILWRGRAGRSIAP